VKSRLHALLVSAMVSGLAACSAFPTSGPQGDLVRLEGNVSSPAPTALSYEFVTINADNIGPLSVTRLGTLSGTFSDRRAKPLLLLGVGDVMGVSIFEAAPGGLFTPSQTSGARPGNFVDLPQQAVDQDGNISIPYAGLIRAAGKTIPQVQFAIQERLKNRAIEPQAVVSLVTQHATVASVLGEVNTPGTLALSYSGERILEVIARAGGPKFPMNEIYVTLTRDGKKARVLLANIVHDPKQDIFVRPFDTIYLDHEILRFAAVGATFLNGLYNFDNDHISLSEAIAKTEGLLDTQADATSVFVFRLENAEFLQKIGVDTTKYTSETVPTVYGVNLRDPSGYLLANSFQLRQSDTVFVGNALSVEYSKILNVVNNTATTARNVNQGWRGR
jgi:polysaccharide export outer membrane protein